LEFSDAAITNYYNQNRYRFETPERVLASHILFMTQDVATGEAFSEEKKAELKTMAEGVLARVKAGEDFATLAKEYSGDPGSKDNGGDLGWVLRGQMVPEFEAAVFALQPNQVTDQLVETDFGYHIIKAFDRDEPRVRELDEVRPEIVADLSAEKQATEKFERVDKVIAALREASDVDQAAQELGLPVQTLKDFHRQDTPEFLRNRPTFGGDIFSATLGDVVTHTEEDGSTLIAKITQITPAREPTFEEVAAQVRQDYVAAEARKLAEAAARELAESASDGNLSAAASRMGVKTLKSAMFKRTEGVEGFAPGQTIGNAAFDGEIGSIHGPVTTGDRFGVYKVLAHEPADMTLYPDQREEIRSQFLEAKKDEAYSIFRQSVMQRYEQEGKITRYPERIDQFVRQLRAG
jgi:peptidyl-prolyl cis-trans isomerase D